MSTPEIDNFYYLLPKKPEITAATPAATQPAPQSPLPLVETQPKVESQIASNPAFLFLKPNDPKSSANITNSIMQPKGPFVNQYVANSPLKNININFENPVNPTTKENPMAKALPGYYVLKDDQARAEQLGRNLAKITDNEKQLGEYQRLTSLGVSKSDATILAGALSSLKDGVIVDAARGLTKIKGSDELRTYAGVQLANQLAKINEEKQLEVMQVALDTRNQTVRMVTALKVPELAVRNQVPATDKVVATNDKNVINSLALVAHNTDRTVQVDVVDRLFKSGFENVQTTIAQNEGKFAKENQISIYQQLMTSEHQSVLETAAGNIYTMHKDNQLSAVNITKDTKNEAAINAAAAQIAKYDAEAQKEIEKSLLELNNKKIEETIQAAKAQAAEDAKVKAEKEAEEEKKQAEVKAKADEEAKSSASKKTDEPKNLSEAIKNISNSPNKRVLLKEALKNASQADKLDALKTLSSSDLFLVMSFMLDDGPSGDVISLINERKGELGISEQQQIEVKLSNRKKTYWA